MATTARCTEVAACQSRPTYDQRPIAAIGVRLFRESLNHYEVAGIVLAVAALVLLMRFA